MILKNDEYIVYHEMLTFVDSSNKGARRKTIKFGPIFRAEISHMRPIQARRLKLFRVSIQGKLTLMYFNPMKTTNNFSEWDAHKNAPNVGSVGFEQLHTQQTKRQTTI